MTAEYPEEQREQAHHETARPPLDARAAERLAARRRETLAGLAGLSGGMDGAGGADGGGSGRGGSRSLAARVGRGVAGALAGRVAGRALARSRAGRPGGTGCPSVP
ncbi:hypothetical protein GEV43_06635 [Actinomadura sp. J1-007]|uniref:hypothetical protein n=1 Tax=Actinomadura sp. J1-007 TaxID=2661913 RepID=UPI00132A3BCC|nr:hypothetical protein [Actinomadura sp. J1-007]MWK33754.1 hypothetical protein [Actinomadura sp. J1-007]